MAIKLVVEVYSSRNDMYGNSYGAFAIINVGSNKTTVGTLGGSSGGGNVVHYLRNLGYEWDDIHVVEHELPIRAFNRTTKSWPYLDDEEQLAAALKANGVKLPRRKRR